LQGAVNKYWLKRMRVTCTAEVLRVFLFPQVLIERLLEVRQALGDLVPDEIIVLKFGSSVLSSRADIPSAVHDIYRWHRQGLKVIAVVSAMAKATEELLAQAREISENPEPWATAELLATGERTSAALMGLCLDRAGVPARVANPREIGLEVEGAALDGEPVAVNAERVRQLLDVHPVLVVPGFFGTDASGRTQLLGRGGSDLTAVLLAVALRARARLCKDVDGGVYELDPANESTHPKRFSQLSYADALRVAGKLIQPKAVAYLERHQAHCEVAALALPYETVIHGGCTERASLVAGKKDRPPIPLDVIILGLGTVGFGVYQRLRAFPARFRVLGILVQNPANHIAAGVPASLLHTSIEAIKALRPQLAIDALPGIEPSHSMIRHTLGLGVNVISTNKAVVAEYGTPLQRVALAAGATLLYSAAVGGSAPLLETVDQFCLPGEIESIEAVLNGTCNFLLETCASGTSLSDALAQAERFGFAEADPADDLSGRDAARKLAILARAEDIDLDMKHAGDAKPCRHLAGQYVQVLEALEHSGERAGIGVSHHSEAT
jgi:homoserine dehydrogenase